MQDLELWYYQWKTLLALGIEKDYRAQEIIHKNQQMGLQPIQKLLQSKGKTRIKRKPTEWEKILTSFSVNRVLSRTQKEINNQHGENK